MQVDNANPMEKINPEELEDQEVEYSGGTDIPARVILFDDEWHTFEQVTEQIIIAIKCNLQQAESLTWMVHSKGKALVYKGDMGECLKVSEILEEIDLGTRVEY